MNTPAPTGPIAIVGLGASAGGLQAYIEFFEALPATTGMAFVVVQHLAAEQESLLATILARSTPMRVIEVTDEPHVEPNSVYVIPPNRSMLIATGRFTLAERDPGIPHAIDIFLTSLAESLGHRALGVVFSGTGSDGVMGMEAIKAGGGITFAQDQSAQHAGMPQSAIESGVVDFILPPRGIALEIARLASSQELLFGNAFASASEGIEAILEVIRESLKVDFSQYKPNTLQRRIRRRMALHKATTLEDYKALLKDNPKEVEALHQDILISVTNFFRDPESFSALKQSLLPRLFDRERFDEPLRVWVLGCSTGEEAYSLAILLQEYMLEIQRPVPMVIFATDVNNTAVESARKAWYPKSIEQDVSSERLQKFFVEVDGGYCVGKSTRDLCVFARHNGLTDPPFSRIDLMSCRNMLIYLQAGLQRRLLPMLHYALKPHGVLFLGPSENISHHRDLFDVEDAHHKLFTKRGTQRRLEAAFPITTLSGVPVRTPVVRSFGVAAAPAPALDLQRELDRAFAKHYVPAGVVVNDEGEVLQIRGDMEPYLSLGEGKVSFSLLKMAREGLLAPLRGILHRLKHNEPVTREEGVLVKTNNGLLAISLNVITVAGADASQRCHGIFFEPHDPSQVKAAKVPARRTSKVKYVEEAERQNQVLTQELAATRDYLESTIELQQALNEELQSANEEVQSTNEELQSSNEELETSKEEIQSSNEELTTVNEELRVRNNDLNRANDDLTNLFGSVQMAVVMVWADMRIRRYTPLAQKFFNLRPADIGRSIGDMNLGLDLPGFPQLLQDVIDQGLTKEQEVRGRDGHTHLLRIRPYRTEGNQIDGAVIVLIDVDVLARTQENLKKRVDELATADRRKGEFLAILAHELRNPLAPLRNAVQILKLSPGNEDVSAKARDSIERQVKHMSRMVNDLLDAARAERGQIKLQLERVDLRTIAEHAVEEMRPQFEARCQELHFHVPPEPVWIEGDAIRLNQVLTNLLNNANKYTQERGRIEVQVEPSDPRTSEAPLAVLRVRDDGQGIDREMLPYLFDIFVQAERSLAHTKGGLGIGLNLVRTLTELHGGTVIGHSDGLNLGSEFVIRIPVLKVDGPAASEGSVQASMTSPAQVSTDTQRVLIVDDNTDISESTAILLTYAGHEVRTAGSGEQALEVAAEFQPTVVLLDIGLPDMEGYEVARRLRRVPKLATVRLIAVSGYDTPEARSRSVEAGFDYHLGKPVDLSALETLIAT